MKKIDKTEYKNYIQSALECTANRVYPLSIAENRQSGEIYTDAGGNVLFWHYCGFAYISGKPDRGFLEKIYKMFFASTLERRFLLITCEESVLNFFSKYDELEIGKRVEYAHHGMPDKQWKQDTQLIVERITSQNIHGIQGRIVPSFSWSDEDSFLSNGFGYVVRDAEQVVAGAFSSAVSSTEIDIGVETKADYRNRGLASSLSCKMCEEILKIGKHPVWAHAESNSGSRNTAMGVGFVPYQINAVIKRK